MPYYQCFFDGTRTIVSEVGEFTALHLAQSGFRPEGQAVQATCWANAKARLIGRATELQERLIAADGEEERRAIVKAHFDLWHGIAKEDNHG